MLRLSIKCTIFFIFSYYLTIDRGCGVLIGMQAPIEVVEEWTCYDQPIRLTCGHLDSLVTVLEATFTPNCTDREESACSAFNVLAQSYIMEHRSSYQFMRQIEMGRKFLQELRQIHEESHQNVDGSQNEAAMRVSLEQLLEKYLMTAPERSEFESRRRRQLTRDHNFTEPLEAGSVEYNEVVEEEEETETQEFTTKAPVLPSVCLHNRRRISHLDKIELENSLRADSEAEFNIRNLVNYRCSGKNHCSFVFSADHPLAVVWDSGLVRIKYACMDSFRIARYCNEKLLLDNEVDLPDFMRTASRRKGEMLENLDMASSGSGWFEEPRAEARVQAPELSSNFHQFTNLKILTPAEDPVLRKKKPKIYSQDFQKLKILQTKASDEVTNDIEARTEVFIKRDDLFETETLGPPPDDTTQFMLPPVPPQETSAPPEAEDWRDEIARKYPNILDSNELLKPDNIEQVDSIETITDNLLENLEEYVDSSEDSSEDRKIYSSIQRTASSKPLMQGFIMSPGYPKYYVGSLECKWRIVAPVQQKIRLTILDLAIRYEDICMDYIQVTDVESNKLLYNGCKESNKPVEIVSISNELEISFKTVSKLAYPKRGVLMHYTALGCIIPLMPPNVNLAQRSEHFLAFECDAGFLFPDSANSSRELVCTDRHTWDKTLPNCVEQIATEGSGIVARFNQADVKSTRMTDKNAHMLYDIVIPSVLIGVLFIVNAIVVMVIMHYRRRRSNDDQDGGRGELAEL